MATIIYDLECDFAHRFEGWFRSAEDFDSQHGRHLITCPQCGSSSVRKVPSRINIGSNDQSRTVADTPANGAVSAGKSNTVDVATAFVMAKQVIQALVAHSEDVGERFAEEARKIHYEEAPARAIRGQASPEECEELRDEGIDIVALPNLGPDTSSLN